MTALTKETTPFFRKGEKAPLASEEMLPGRLQKHTIKFQPQLETMTPPARNKRLQRRLTYPVREHIHASLLRPNRK